MNDHIAANLPASIHQRLNMYALAAGAAGVGILSAANPAEAKVVYTKTQQAIGLHHAYRLDLNHDGTIDFVLRETESGSQGFKVIRLAAKPQSGNEVEGFSRAGRGYGVALQKGMLIGRHQQFTGARLGEFMATVQQSDTVFYKYYGQWQNLTNHYLGLRFKILGKIHFGWARLNVNFHGFKISATLTGYAYETIPGKAIIAGATKGLGDSEPTASVSSSAPHPSTLGALALGAPGLAIWRRDESVVF